MTQYKPGLHAIENDVRPGGLVRVLVLLHVAKERYDYHVEEVRIVILYEDMEMMCNK